MSANSVLYLTRAQSRAVDEIAIRDFGMSGLVLMENAGRNCAEFILRRLNGHTVSGQRIAICCGKGNNGGDGFVIARHLAIAGADPTVLLWTHPRELAGDASVNYAILVKSGARIVQALEPNAIDEMEMADRKPAIVVDALLGTGSSGPARPPYDIAIHWINSRHTMVFAIDLPSGIDAETGTPFDPAVRATYSLSFVGLKTGFRNPAAASFLGECHVIDIGVPRAVIDAAKKL